MAATQNLIARFEPQTIRCGNYEAQRQLDHRVLRGQTLRILSPSEQAILREREKDEHDFRIAMQRRNEPAGASLAEMAKKYGLE